VFAYAITPWAALGDPTRRTIFELLVDGPRAVNELARRLPVSRPAVSQHLKVLKEAGLVVDRPAGRQRIYAVDPAGLAQLRGELEQFWSKTLVAYKSTVEQPTEEERMSTQTEPTAIHTQITVEAPVERAFRVFTEGFDRFKPREHNMLAVEIAETVFEPRAGGRIFDRGVDGSEFQWARVLAFEPPDRVVFSWDLSPQWQIESDPEKTSEVEVRFIPEGPARTRVELEHRHLERHGEGWPAMRAAIDGDDGWPLYLKRYAEVIAREG
jgi:DNA-binding transcriptional ArsR family regulator/uncharacterized protein YndB with AHSA1/START domain